MVTRRPGASSAIYWSEKTTYRQAEAAYGIPKSTLFDYAIGKC